MFEIDESKLKNMDDETLEIICREITKEKDCRARKKRENLINAFQVAFNNLRNANIDITYNNDCCDEIYIDYWENFEFD